MAMKELKRCPWPTNDPLMIEYHDMEWGVPLHDDRKIFEFIVLEGMQAGLELGNRSAEEREFPQGL